MKLITSDILDRNKTIRQYSYMKQNVINTYDNLINFQQQTLVATFYQIDRTVRRDYIQGIKPNVYFMTVLNLAPEGMYFERDAYNVFDFIGDLGGVSGIITTVFGIMCYPYAQFAYNLRVAKELYRARTKDTQMFDNHC